MYPFFTIAIAIIATGFLLQINTALGVSRGAVLRVQCTMTGQCTIIIDLPLTGLLCIPGTLYIAIHSS